MTDFEGLFHIGKIAARSGDSGKARFNELLKGAQSATFSTEKPLYEKLSETTKNPNIDYRLVIFDPIMRLSFALAKKYDCDYDKIRRAIEGLAYKSEGIMMLEGLVGWKVTPSSLSVASVGKAPGFLSILLNMVPLMMLKGREYEFDKTDIRTCTRHFFWRLLEPLSEELAGVNPGVRDHGRHMAMSGLLSWEAVRQIRWDKKISQPLVKQGITPTMIIFGFEGPLRASELTVLQQSAQQLDQSGLPQTRQDTLSPEDAADLAEEVAGSLKSYSDGLFRGQPAPDQPGLPQTRQDTLSPEDAADLAEEVAGSLKSYSDGLFRGQPAPEQPEQTRSRLSDRDQLSLVCQEQLQSYNESLQQRFDNLELNVQDRIQEFKAIGVGGKTPSQADMDALCTDVRLLFDEHKEEIREEKTEQAQEIHKFIQPVIAATSDENAGAAASIHKQCIERINNDWNEHNERANQRYQQFQERLEEINEGGFAMQQWGQ